MPKRINDPLSKDDTKRIKKNWTFLKENLLQNEIRDSFIDNEIWDLRDLEEIDTEKIQEKKNEIFLILLLKSGPRAYGVFIEALKNTGSNHIIEKLQATVITEKSVNDRVIMIYTLLFYQRID